MAKSIAECYADQKILITGATGFMGKVLVEKLLWSCPKVAAIYVLLRPKKGKCPKERLEDYFKETLFDRLRNESNSKEMFGKILGVNGDIIQKNCGVSEADTAVLEEAVTMVFHMAADVRFNQSLKTAVHFNVNGTLNILELARNFKQLKAFVHLSTLYCHCAENVLEERLYKTPHNPRDIINLLSWLDESSLRLLTPRLIKSYPNTYAYTKCLAEGLVSEYSDILPIIIARPSTVTAAYKEPIPGWVDNLQGITGILVASGKGLLRSLPCNEELKFNVIPVDASINSLLIVASKSGAVAGRNKAEVYHIMTRKELCITWKEIIMLLKKFYYMYPYSLTLWYPGISLTSSYMRYLLSAFFYQCIPAYILDFLMMLARKKPVFIGIQKRINCSIKIFSYYTLRQWNFENRKLLKLYDSLNKSDRDTFYLNRHAFDFEEYQKNYHLGVRKYCVKEDLDTVPRARKFLKRWNYVRLLTNFIFYGLLIWVIFIFI